MSPNIKAFVDKLVALNGEYPGDPPIFRIVEYTDMGGKLVYGIEYEHQVGTYSESIYIRNPRTYWERTP